MDRRDVTIAVLTAALFFDVAVCLHNRKVLTKLKQSNKRLAEYGQKQREKANYLTKKLNSGDTKITPFDIIVVNDLCK